MAAFRIEKTRDYTVMANHHLRNTALSLKAKGLLSLMLSLPEDWDYCPECAARMKRINAAKRKRKQREKCHTLEAEKPL